MNRVFFKRSVLAGLGLVAALGAALPSEAHRTSIDGNPLIPITACTLGGASCAATPMGFTANFGSGSFSGLYIYSNGLISFGNEIAAGANLSSLATIGGNIITAGYSPTMTRTNMEYATGISEVRWVGRPVIRVRYQTHFGSGDSSPTQVDIYDIGDGQYALEFDYGFFQSDCGGYPGDDDAQCPPYEGPADIANDAYIGYSIVGGGSLQVNSPRLRVQSEFPGDFSYIFSTAVPEPASWAMMIFGFGMVGGAARRRRAIANLSN